MENGQPREKVAVVKYDGTPNSLKKAIDLCDGFKELKPDHKILLKPNIRYAFKRPCQLISGRKRKTYQWDKITWSIKKTCL